MFSKTEIVKITRTTLYGAEGNFPVRSTNETVLAVFKYYSDAVAALKGMLASMTPGTTLAIRHHYSEEASALYDESTVPTPAADLDPYDGVPADTGTV